MKPKSNPIGMDFQLKTGHGVSVQKPFYQSVKLIPSEKPKVIQSNYIQGEMNYRQFLHVADNFEPPETESYADRETRWWQELKDRGYGEGPIYCELSGTRFHSDSPGWNLSKFTARESILHALPEHEWLNGIQKPYYYLGLYKIVN